MRRGTPEQTIADGPPQLRDAGGRTRAAYTDSNAVRGVYAGPAQPEPAQRLVLQRAQERAGAGACRAGQRVGGEGTVEGATRRRRSTVLAASHSAHVRCR